MPRSPPSGNLPTITSGSTTILAGWRYAMTAPQRLQATFPAVNPPTLLALLAAYALTRARLDVLLIASFFLSAYTLFHLGQSPCAASAVNTTDSVQESPSDVESLLDSLTAPEGDLKSVIGVIAGNLAARESHPPPSY